MLYGVTVPTVEKEEKSIELSTADVDRMILLWEKRWKRPPTQKELDGLIEQSIRESVLYREALAMGLEKDDPVVRRRLAQKVEFISNDIITINTPEDEVLQAYLDAHASKYRLPGKISFKQIYFNPAKHDASMQSEAEQLLVQLGQENHELNISDLGDSFLYGTKFDTLKEFELNRLFGKDFSKKIFTLEEGKWLGPLASGYGLHLIYIDTKSLSRTASLEDAKESVLQDWISDERKKANKSFIENLSKQYTIKVSKPTKALLPENSSK